MRIGINVPNELLNQVKQLSPEINISQVCREALQHRVEIARKAAALASMDGMDELIAQFDQSVPEPIIAPDWEAYGFEDAQNWVRVVTPEIWERFIYQYDFLLRQGRDPAEMVDLWSTDGNVRGFNSRQSDHKDWFLEQHEILFEAGIDVNLFENALKEYARAWLDYVNEARRRLEKLRKERYDKVMAERAASWQARPEPEAPTQLL